MNDEYKATLEIPARVTFLEREIDTLKNRLKHLESIGMIPKVPEASKVPEPPVKHRRIKCNRIRCKRCDDIIESRDIYDQKFCKCRSVAIDGGKDYQRILWASGNSEEWIENLIIYEDD